MCLHLCGGGGIKLRHSVTEESIDAAYIEGGKCECCEFRFGLNRCGRLRCSKRALSILNARVYVIDRPQRTKLFDHSDETGPSQVSQPPERRS